jgi:putative nucleotidyltransferase with HDIG domain
LFDVKNQVGGLIHLLLPEPISTEGARFPEKYASTGLPAFIQALLREGASLESMQGVIAGGALVGPLMAQDLSLDIGGRTAEIVKTILSQAGIPIIKSETGGFFTCRISLNLQTFKTEIEPIALERYKPDQKPIVPSPEKISKALDHIFPIPQVALKILRLVEEDNYDLGAIADEVKKDQVISAKTLQLCNSALFSRGKPIDTLDHAILLLGRDLLVQLVVSAAVKGFFDLKGHGYSLCKGGLFYHAIGTAQVAAILAATAGKATKASAYTAGLLHDIGKVVLDQYISSAFPLFYRNLVDLNKNSIEVEQEILGIDHTKVGRMLAEKWSFPNSLIHVIEHHHSPENEETYSNLAHMVYLADLLITKFHPGLEMERMDGNNLDQRLQKIGLSASRLPEIVDLIPPSVFLNTSETFARVG